MHLFKANPRLKFNPQFKFLCFYKSVYLYTLGTKTSIDADKISDKIFVIVSLLC